MSGLLQLILIFLAALAICGLCIFRPEWRWKLDHLLSVKDGEPSDIYITTTRVGGVIGVWLAVISFILMLNISL